MTILAPQDAARRLGLSTNRLIQLDREGILPAIRDSAVRRFWDAEAVERFAVERARRRGLETSKAVIPVAAVGA